jgi:putative ABC transport system permease protein
MMNLKLAFKNVFRNRARTAITLVAIAFGCIAIIVTGGLMADLLHQLRELTITCSLGHLQVYKKGYSEKGVLRPYDFMISKPDELMDLIAKLPHVRRAAPRVQFSGLLSSGDTTISFAGEGVDPGPEAEISSGIRTISGEPLQAGDGFHAVLGMGLARAFEAKLGDSFVLVANSKEGAINALDVAFKGSYATGAKDVDDRTLRVPLKTAQKLLHTEDIHSIVLMLDRTENTDLVKGELDKLFRERGLDLEVKPWYEMADFYVKTDIFLRRQFVILKIIIGIVVVLSVFTTMNMSLLQLPPPPGRSLAGVARVMVVPAVLWQSMWLAVIATVVSSVYPAVKAARLEIAEALRQNI